MAKAIVIQHVKAAPQEVLAAILSDGYFTSQSPSGFWIQSTIHPDRHLAFKGPYLDYDQDGRPISGDVVGLIAYDDRQILHQIIDFRTPAATLAKWVARPGAIQADEVAGILGVDEMDIFFFR